MKLLNPEGMLYAQLAEANARRASRPVGERLIGSTYVRVDRNRNLPQLMKTDPTEIVDQPKGLVGRVYVNKGGGPISHPYNIHTTYERKGEDMNTGRKNLKQVLE